MSDKVEKHYSGGQGAYGHETVVVREEIPDKEPKFWILTRDGQTIPIKPGALIAALANAMEGA